MLTTGLHGILRAPVARAEACCHGAPFDGENPVDEVGDVMDVGLRNQGGNALRPEVSQNTPDAPGEHRCNPSDGSSRRSSLWPTKSARASATSFCCPPDRAVAGPPTPDLIRSGGYWPTTKDQGCGKPCPYLAGQPYSHGCRRPLLLIKVPVAGS